MSDTNQTIQVTLQLPRDVYQQAAQTADAEQRGLEDLLNLLIAEGLVAHTTVQQIWEATSAQYCDRLHREGKLPQSSDEVMQTLRDLREQVADELYPE